MPYTMGRMADRKNRARPVLFSPVEARRRLAPRAGQAVIEYAFLLIILATITMGVIFLAGQQVTIAFNDVVYDTAHIGDPAPVTVSPHTCADGTAAVFRHTKWRCNNE